MVRAVWLVGGPHNAEIPERRGDGDSYRAEIVPFARRFQQERSA